MVAIFSSHLFKERLLSSKNYKIKEGLFMARTLKFIQCNETGKLYATAYEVADDLNLILIRIIRCLVKKQKKTKGYSFHFIDIDEKNINMLNIKKASKNAKKYLIRQCGV